VAPVMKATRRRKTASKGLIRWLGGAACITLYDMKTAALTIRLDPELQRQLARLARRTGRAGAISRVMPCAGNQRYASPTATPHPAIAEARVSDRRRRAIHALEGLRHNGRQRRRYPRPVR
jgi:hypothetical protein